MPSEQEDARARQLEALRRYMAHPDTQWEPPAELGLVHGQAAAEAAGPPGRRRPGRTWLLVTGLLVAAALVGGVVVGAAAWSDDRPARATAGVTATDASQPDAGGAGPVATPACKTAVDRANAMLASAVKLRAALGEQDRLLADPANREQSVGQLAERLAASRQAATDESARFDRALEAYRQVVDRCDLRVP
ncbi:MAG TPA: hypothetical protein VHM23_08625 [Actinomycetota bacterium]|jgi:hypothetical protein|nr:hypothetical protein [Actinomycetota bacterium]